MIGKHLAHYEILKKIRTGRDGSRVEGRDTTLDREAAVKILPDIFAQDPERRARFEREAKLLAQLNHPRIATVFGLPGLVAATRSHGRPVSLEIISHAHDQRSRYQA